MSDLLSTFSCVNNLSDIKKFEELGEKFKQYTDTEELMSKFTSIITATCDTTFNISGAGDRFTKGIIVPWWTSELTILRKRTVSLRRRYQRKRSDDDLRQERKLWYQEGKKHYQAKLKDGKFR